MSVVFSLYFIESLELESVEFYYSNFEATMTFSFRNLLQNPFLNYGNYYYVTDVPCFLDQLVFKNTMTNEIFQAEYPGTCNSYVNNVIIIRINQRDYLRMVLDEFIDAASVSTASPTLIEMYTVNMLGYPFDLRIQSNDTFRCDFSRNPLFVRWDQQHGLLDQRGNYFVSFLCFNGC